MRRRRELTLVLTGWMLIGWVTTPALCGERKVAVADVSRLIQAHPDAIEAHAFLKKQAAEFEGEQKTILERMEQLRDEFMTARDGAQNKALSETARQREHKKAEELLQAIREAEQKARETLMQRQRELNELQRERQAEVAEKIRGEVKAVAQAKGLSLVLDASAKDARGHDVVLYHGETLDITDTVLKRIAPDKQP